MFKFFHGNTIKDVKTRLLFIFSSIALTSTFLAFFPFSLYLVINEDNQVAQHLASFEQIATEHYALIQNDFAQLSPHVNAYYNEAALPDRIKQLMPFTENVITRHRPYDEDGFIIFHTSFIDLQGKKTPLYLTIDALAIEFGDDGWYVLMLISFALMIFLITFLRFSLQRMFDGLMSPVMELSHQLQHNHNDEFSVSERSIDELQTLTKHLNEYKQMKERLARQELMFAKYASHELKTPIAIVLGAANLQGMKDDPVFQAKQRERILVAATNMHATVEVLLNIVKQENASEAGTMRVVSENEIPLDKFRAKLKDGVKLNFAIDPETQLNLPEPVLAMLLKNLVNNAIRFTRQGHITIHIDNHTISVTDTGCGLTGSTETEHGLGLLIVKRLCQSYGWGFELKSNPKQGCTATLRLLINPS
ncbi:two-component sensor histidine kinase [Photobacterium proteolyticum]|uniref:histidine kinase n=1 Tax=Photobacterium proteolyticum TaxID=1903952 RepID=A0A1Q9GMM7_9GAMM|nr:HAMP domain-containing sensor histidine kinase [Photobacterium proteolyticum]OLQ75737.1 two-component sensor histidine kinase [Photobacterium proteolyticum]